MKSINMLNTITNLTLQLFYDCQLIVFSFHFILFIL